MLVLAIWDPHLSKDILAFENTQKFALRACLKNWKADYDLLNQAHLLRLSSRRKILKLIACSSAFSEERLFIMIPRLLGGHLPIPTDSRTLYNYPLYTCQN